MPAITRTVWEMQAFAIPRLAAVIKITEVVLRPALMGTKNLYENGPDPFFLFFFRSYGNENGPDSYSQIRLSVS